MLVILLAACGGRQPQTPEPRGAAPDGEAPKEARFEDLDPLLGRWPAPTADGCDPAHGLELINTLSTTGYGLVDHRANPPITYEITGDRRGPDGILRMGLRAAPGGLVSHAEIAFSAAGDLATVTWTQPPLEPFQVLTPEGAGARDCR